MNIELQKKIDKSLRLISSAAGDDMIEVCYSGGKDSDVILQLCKMACVNYRPIYKSTTIDPPGTISHVLKNNVEILRPSKGFFKIIESYGFPTRRARFCCEYLKEYKVLDKAILGIRREESIKRFARYHEPIICRFYSKKEKVQQILPILEWTLKDVELFIKKYEIELAPHYYDDGRLCLKKRLGCMCCPLASDNGLSDFKNNPKYVSLWIDSALKWWNTHPNIKSKERFEDVYSLFLHNIFFKSYEEYRLFRTSVFNTASSKEYLENYFKITLK